MKKRSNTLSDAGLNIASSALLPVSAAANATGSLIGLFENPSKEDLKLFNLNQWLSAVPGVSGYRLGVRRKQLAGDFKNKLFSESLGVVSSAALLALAGSFLGDTTEKKLMGAAGGAGTALAAHGIGSLIGVLRKPRTDALQEEYEANKVLSALQYLIPGFAGYGAGRNFKKSMLIDKDLRKKASDGSPNLGTYGANNLHLNGDANPSSYFHAAQAHSKLPIIGPYINRYGGFFGKLFDAESAEYKKLKNRKISERDLNAYKHYSSHRGATLMTGGEDVGDRFYKAYDFLRGYIEAKRNSFSKGGRITPARSTILLAVKIMRNNPEYKNFTDSLLYDQALMVLNSVAHNKNKHIDSNTNRTA